MEEIEIAAVSERSTIEEALARLRETSRAAVCVDARGGPRLLFADELLRELEFGPTRPVGEVKPSVRTVGVSIPGGSISLASHGLRRGVETVSERADYTVVGIRNGMARVLADASGAARLLASPSKELFG